MIRHLIYRAMLFVARTVLSEDVCLIIYLSDASVSTQYWRVTGRLSHASIALKRLNISSNFFHCRVVYSYTTTFFLHQTVWQYSDGDPPGAPNAGV